jgi:pSer/pThr/pTyr-binding forkhead associated (FHA) protein
MRLVVKQHSKTVNEFRFVKGPIYIGRHTHCQVLLPDRTVSRQHAVIFSTQAGKWIVEDLDSANSTYLNDKVIHKAEIKSGDRLRIGEFTIGIDLEEPTKPASAIHLEDTLVPPSRKAQIITRTLDFEHTPGIQLPAKRFKDFVEATEAVSKANGLGEVLETLLNIVLTQFTAYCAWCTLRNSPTGPMTAQGGRKRNSKVFQLTNIGLKERISRAVEDEKFLLMLVPEPESHQPMRSAIIAPILGAAGSFGVVYIENDMSREHYSLSDLDYIMLLSIHTAAILANF